jgi:polyphosphate kinase 2
MLDTKSKKPSSSGDKAGKSGKSDAEPRSHGLHQIVDKHVSKVGVPYTEKRLDKLIGNLNRRDHDRIVDSALRSYFDSEALKPYQAELIKVQAHLEATGRKAIILFDGRDASGKGGTIRRVTRYMNEKHYRTVALGKPSTAQRTELHMKRYIEQFPHAGEIVLFDRSWYNRAMVEPVMGFCSRRQYLEFLRKVNDYEDSFVSDKTTTLLKLYFSVSKKEQSRRFNRRKNDPLRHWKLSEVDLQAQRLWDEFTEMKYRLLVKTHTPKNPWFVVRSDDKQAARLETMKLILSRIPYRGRSRSLDFRPDPNIIIPGDKEIEIMDKQRRKTGRYVS